MNLKQALARLNDIRARAMAVYVEDAERVEEFDKNIGPHLEKECSGKSLKVQAALMALSFEQCSMMAGLLGFDPGNMVEIAGGEHGSSVSVIPRDDVESQAEHLCIALRRFGALSGDVRFEALAREAERQASRPVERSPVARATVPQGEALDKKQLHKKLKEDNFKPRPKSAEALYAELMRGGLTPDVQSTGSRKPHKWCLARVKEYLSNKNLAKHSPM